MFGTFFSFQVLQHSFESVFVELENIFVCFCFFLLNSDTLYEAVIHLCVVLLRMFNICWLPEVNSYYYFTDWKAWQCFAVKWDFFLLCHTDWKHITVSSPLHFNEDLSHFKCLSFTQNTLWLTSMNLAAQIPKQEHLWSPNLREVSPPSPLLGRGLEVWAALFSIISVKQV